MERLKQNYSLKKVIGDGTFARLWLAKDKKAKKKVAIKQTKKTDNNIWNIENELKISAILLEHPHPNVVEIRDIFEDDSFAFVVMEYFEEGDLLTLIRKRRNVPEEKEARRILWQLLNALVHLHSLRVAHRDVKLENLCVDKKGNVKLIDFNLSLFFSETSTEKRLCGSPSYVTPEMCAGHPYNGPEVDAWSFGVLSFVLLFAVFPFSPPLEHPSSSPKSLSEKDGSLSARARKEGKESIFEDPYIEDDKANDRRKKALVKIISLGQYSFPSFPPVSETAKQLIQSLLVLDTTVRASLTSLRSHAFFEGITQEEENKGKKQKKEKEKPKTSIKPSKEKEKGREASLKNSEKDREKNADKPRDKKEAFLSVPSAVTTTTTTSTTNSTNNSPTQQKSSRNPSPIHGEQGSTADSQSAKESDTDSSQEQRVEGKSKEQEQKRTLSMREDKAGRETGFSGLLADQNLRRSQSTGSLHDDGGEEGSEAQVEGIGEKQLHGKGTVKFKNKTSSSGGRSLFSRTLKIFSPFDNS